MSAICLGGVVETTVEGFPVCKDPAGNVTAWTYQANFDPSQIDTTVAGAAFGVGFMIVATVCVIGLGARAMVRFVRQL